MPINTRTLVLAAVAENAIGVPLQRGLPIALFASTLRPMTGLIFALLLGRTLATATPSGFSIAVPPATGGTGTGGTGTGGGSIPASMPSFLQMSRSDAKAWAVFFQLTPTFKQSGKMVVSQTPDVGDPMPTDKNVTLEMGDYFQNVS
jgi:hypothetical protein